MSNYPKPKWTIFSHAKLRLSGEAWDPKNQKHRPSLMYKVHNNNPRFLVYMNNDKDQGAQSFALDPYIAGQIFQMVEMVTAKKEPSRLSIELKSSWIGGARQEKPVVTGKIMVGRGDDSVVYVAFQSKGKDLARFPFVESYFATMKDETGEQLNVASASEICARAWADTLKGLTYSYMVVHGKEPAERPGSGKGGYSYSGGGGNQSSNSGGGGWDDPSDF